MVFVVALLGNMTINKTLGYYGAKVRFRRVAHYTSMMLVCLVFSAILLALVSETLPKTPKN